MEYPFKDLMPLDEVLEREGYYKDWTHLDPEVFYSLTQISEYIKTKGYGVDVRLLIAQLAEHFGLKTTQVVDLANLLQQKFTNLEGVTQSFTNNINSLVAQMEADKDAVIANATVDSEVILARGGKPTLQARLDETTAQLADIVQVDVKSFFIDGQVDWTIAIKNAVNYANTLSKGLLNKPKILFPYNDNGYEVSDTISIPHNINVEMESPLIYTGIDDKDILVIGTSTTIGYTQNYKLNVVRRIPDWTNTASAIKIYHCFQSDIKIIQASNSKYGVTLMGDTNGFGYNSFHLFLLIDNQYHLRFRALNNGWVNENVFTGGRFTNHSINKNQDRYGVLMESETGRINANVFYKPSFEIAPFADDSVESVPVVINPGTSNRFYDCRNEGNGLTFAKISGNSEDNTFSLTYTDLSGEAIIDDTSTGRLGNYINKSTSLEQTRILYDSGFLPNKSYVSKDGAYKLFRIGDLHALPLSASSNVDDVTPFLNVAENVLIDKTNIGLSSPVGLGRFITTKSSKELKLSVSTLDNAFVGVYLVAFDENDTQIIDNGVKGNGVVNSPSFGGSYQIGAMNNTPRIVRVATEVKKIALFITRYNPSTPLKLIRLVVEQITNTTRQSNQPLETTFSPFDYMNNHIMVEGIPKIGRWEKGQILTESKPIMGGYSQYVCLTTGDFITVNPTFGKVGLIS